MELTPDLRNKLDEHIGEHVDSWPATKGDLVAACNDMSDFSSEEKEWFSKTLPERTYNSPEEVKQALRM
jgi:hypothetical protein